MKHTKGTWVVDKDSPRFITLVENPIANIALAMGINDVEIEANAKLIAAAPDLLEALKGLVEHCAIDARGEGNYYGKALEAIQKATE